MDVVVSGASGLIGSALGDELHRAGPSRAAAAARRDHRRRRHRLGSPAGLIDAPAFEGVDAVVHLAGEGIGDKRWTDEQKHRILESRVRGTSVLAGAIASRERKPQVFVSGSAIGYYGDRGDEVLTEDSAPGDDFLAGVVQRGKRRRKPAVDAGIRTVNIRTGIVLAAARRRAEAAPAAVQARRSAAGSVRASSGCRGSRSPTKSARSCTRSSPSRCAGR